MNIPIGDAILVVLALVVIYIVTNPNRWRG